MKTNNQLIELSLCLVCALAPVSLLTLKANPTEPSPSVSIRLADRQSVEGKVSAKTDSSLTVDGKTIAVTGSTSYMKEGKPITLADIQTGDQVKVSASMRTDGSLEALSVIVLAKNSAARLPTM
jgi:hypothetical protein